MDAICVLFLLYSHPKLSLVSDVFDFKKLLNDVAPLSPMLLPVDLMRMEKSGLLMNVICLSFLCSHFRLSILSVVFDFNASLNDVAPISPMPLPVDLRMEKSRLLIDVICVLFLLCSQPILSLVSVVFDFNASLNDVAPVSLIWLSVDLMRMEKSFVDGCNLGVVFLCSPSKKSAVSFVFDFNASNNNLAPVSSIPFSVFVIKRETVDC